MKYNWGFYHWSNPFFWFGKEYYDGPIYCLCLGWVWFNYFPEGMWRKEGIKLGYLGVIKVD